MKIFISWSGKRSKIVAEALWKWIPKVIQSVKPWISSEDIYAGNRWNQEIATELEQSNFGIICLTPENMNKPWILFEAGALAKTINETLVCPYLINLKSSEIKGPLTQFQSAEDTKGGTLNLMTSINCAIDENALDDQRLKDTFNLWWPDLEEILNNLPEPEIDQTPERNEKEILEEILERVRSIGRLENKLYLVMPEKSKDLANWIRPELFNFSGKKDLPNQHYLPYDFCYYGKKKSDEESENGDENLEEK